MSDTPTWLEVGQPVAVVGGLRHDQIRLHVVARFTKTRVVLDNEEWFPLDRLEKRQGGTWGTYYRLADPNDPAIVQKFQSQQIRSAVGQMFSIIRDMGPVPTDEQMADLHRLASKVANRTQARPS